MLGSLPVPCSCPPLLELYQHPQLPWNTVSPSAGWDRASVSAYYNKGKKTCIIFFSLVLLYFKMFNVHTSLTWAWSSWLRFRRFLIVSSLSVLIMILSMWISLDRYLFSFFRSSHSWTQIQRQWGSRASKTQSIDGECFKYLISYLTLIITNLTAFAA